MYTTGTRIPEKELKALLSARNVIAGSPQIQIVIGKLKSLYKTTLSEQEIAEITHLPLYTVADTIDRMKEAGLTVGFLDKTSKEYGYALTFKALMAGVSGNFV